MNKCLRFLLILTFPIPSLFSQTNEGTDFWLGFMEHVNQNANTKILMITSKVNTQGQVSIPRQSWTQAFSVNANEVAIVSIPLAAETMGSEVIRNTGIHVESDDQVTVYAHQYAQFRSEAAVILPTPSLGRSYFSMGYTGLTTNGSIYPSEFLIVATEDETTLTITPSDRTKGGKVAGSTFTVVLNEGQSYQVQSQNGSGSDLTGSFVQGDKPFAMFGGNVWTQVPSTCGTRDNLYEQMYPIETWGTKFVSVPNANASYDVFRVLASEDNTQILRNGVSQGFLDAGEFLEYQISGSATYIEGSKPILVAQFNIGQQCNSSGNVGDPSMVLLNAVEQTRDTITLYSSSFQAITNNFVNIITRTIDTASVFFDGNNIGTQFIPVGSNAEYAYARLSVNAGSHTIESSGCGVIATAYGYGNAESYAYSAGASFLTINSDPIPEGGCLNDTIFFTTGLPETRVTVEWDFGDGTSSNELEPQHIYTQLGAYPVQLIINDLCQNTSDTLNQDFLVTLRQAVEALPDTLLCEGESVQLGATDLGGARYEWTGPLDYFSDEQFPILMDTKPEMTGAYNVVGIISGCATFPKTQYVEFQALPEVDLGNDTTICTGDEIIKDAGIHTTYSWQDGSSMQEYTILEEGVYSVTVTDDLGCVNADSLLIIKLCPPQLFVPTAFTPNNDGANDVFAISATDMITFNFKVFNRWGTLVFQTNNPVEYWTGMTPNGNLAKEGVYYWLATFAQPMADGTNFPRQEAGTVTLDALSQESYLDLD